MIGYYVRLALRSLRRTPVMTALMVCAIGLGIGASMTMLTVLHVMTQDPIPEKSGVLFYPRIDPLPLKYPVDNRWGNPADNLTWPDAMALMAHGKAVHQAAMAGGYLLVWPLENTGRPAFHSGRFTTSDFFAMFNVPFEHGQGWTPRDDADHARVVVLRRDLAMKIFGTTDVVGRSVRLKDTIFRVIGVISPWAPQPRFYADLSSQSFGDTDEFFFPLSLAIELHLGISGSQSSWADSDEKDLMKSPVSSWLQFWVQLDTPQQLSDYRRFLHDYAAQQHDIGRFERAPDATRLYSLMDWLAYRKLVPSEIQLQLWLAMGFLVVCLVNIVALLLAKFLRRGGEIGVRRALGARSQDILLQLGCEAALIGLSGGLLGIGLAQLGLWSIRQRPDDYARIAQMDATMLLSTVALAMLATLLAGLVPAWRASRISPAIQIKGV
ncbi:putative ABC transport system permease protein [Pseudoxanthomonas sp. GM95]|uniref:ABC transporter permease n=1 Tax=Pseudoxanthomonas sp. GM95 TaxID=1881043 RepID=UPI0008C41B19|nr:ABC transporter permease [Pseudoxanthomonas sp. GM95]SEL45084.1 putative ABC transport system permease protein [Pseudoxanthomonas sp. GM95]